MKPGGVPLRGFQDSYTKENKKKHQSVAIIAIEGDTKTYKRDDKRNPHEEIKPPKNIIEHFLPISATKNPHVKEKKNPNII